MIREESGSFLPEEMDVMTDEEFDELEAALLAKPMPRPTSNSRITDLDGLGGRMELPFSIGLPR